MPNGSATQLYVVFHLNLAFSSIDESSHPDVIRQCYWPLLEQIENANVPLGLEMTLYTLECIQKVAPDWIARFRDLLASRHCELIASGDSQIIGPLVPTEVNRWNLALGQAGYQELLGTTPNLAYINEQAVSAGLLDAYLDAGFDAVIIEWDNPSSHHPDWDRQTLDRPRTLKSASGRSVKVIWNHAVAFQKFQRYAHDEITLDDYLASLDKTIGPDCHCFPLYGSDAEVFDYRPGRYQSEAVRQHNEWERLAQLFFRLKQNPQYRLILPSQALAHWRDEQPLAVGTPAHPISVKKQAKYNITRWALSGRNDLLLNTRCFALYKELQQNPQASTADWKTLCRLWASDLRTHLTDKRYERLTPSLGAAAYIPAMSLKEGIPEGFTLQLDDDRKIIRIANEHLQLALNMKRGLSILSLGFSRHAFSPVIGTLMHGHFDHISYSADFYSNHLVMERFRERDRVTDLLRSQWRISHQDDALVIGTEIPTPAGLLHKHYRIMGEAIECTFAFADTTRPESSLRCGYITLLDCQQRPWFACHNGGDREEFFSVGEDIDHGSPVSSIVSANSALGATEGRCRFGSGDAGLLLSWNPEHCAALPMVSSQQVNHRYLNRLWFSLVESDETLKAGGQLLPFAFTIQPCARKLGDATQDKT